MRSLRRTKQVALKPFCKHSRRIGSEKVADGAAKNCKFLPSIGSTFVIGIIDLYGKEPMARVTRTINVDLCFGDPACEVEYFRTGVRPCDLAREAFHLCGPGGNAADGQAQPMAKSVLRRSGSATCGLRAGAPLRVPAVSSSPRVADHCGVKP
jgi:hypothetical protein